MSRRSTWVGSISARVSASRMSAARSPRIFGLVGAFLFRGLGLEEAGGTADLVFDSDARPASSVGIPKTRSQCSTCRRSAGCSEERPCRGPVDGEGLAWSRASRSRNSSEDTTVDRRRRAARAISPSLVTIVRRRGADERCTSRMIRSSALIPAPANRTWTPRASARCGFSTPSQTRIVESLRYRLPATRSASSGRSMPARSGGRTPTT